MYDLNVHAFEGEIGLKCKRLLCSSANIYFWCSTIIYCSYCYVQYIKFYLKINTTHDNLICTSCSVLYSFTSQLNRLLLIDSLCFKMLSDETP
jgi:hypothetical protein